MFLHTSKHESTTESSCSVVTRVRFPEGENFFFQVTEGELIAGYGVTFDTLFFQGPYNLLQTAVVNPTGGPSRSYVHTPAPPTPTAHGTQRVCSHNKGERCKVSSDARRQDDRTNARISANNNTERGLHTPCEPRGEGGTGVGTMARPGQLVEIGSAREWKPSEHTRDNGTTQQRRAWLFF